MEPAQRVAVVTGASQGIGTDLVKGFTGLGYQVVANSRTIKPIASSNVLTVAGDIADPETADRIVEAAISRFGRIDTLVNNACIFLFKPLIEYTDADLSTCVAVNLTGFFHISQRAAARMLQQGRGHIVIITTTLVDQPMAAVPAVLAALTKGGLNAVTRSLALEYAERGVRVNAVSPEIIKTPMHRTETHDFLATLHPVGRMGTIEEIVDAVLYLESVDFVTGEILHVDGGQHSGRW
ncbi:MAG TPA: SDR family oxidoreductase [Acetobacteraceae bacterium]|nr:SDR family oxidoreductase [Acetobacteraceae bacterium]